MALISKLRVRPGKTVYDDKGVILGHGGQMLDLDAPIRESDRSKVTLEQVESGPSMGFDVGVPSGDWSPRLPNSDDDLND